MIAAQDETYRDAKNIHSKWMRHQAFESEIKSNKDRLEKLMKEAEELVEQKPDTAEVSGFSYQLFCCLLSTTLYFIKLSKIKILTSLLQQLSHN